MKDWIDRYVFAVGEKLPRKQRDDIKKELKSAIHDNLEEATKGHYATEEDIKSVIYDFGPPRDLATKYMPANRYIVGPELYDSYILVLGIVLAAMALGLSVASLVGAATKDVSLISLVPGILPSLFSGLISAIGFVTVIFFLIQKFTGMTDDNLFNNPKNWQVEDLSPIPENSSSVRLGDPIASIVFILIALIVFNIFPHKIAVFNINDGVFSSVPFFNLDALRPYAIYMSFVWIVQLFIAVFLLKTRRKTPLSRAAAIMAEFAGVAVLFLAAGNTDLLNPEALTFFPSALQGIFRIGIRVFLVLIIFTVSYNAGKSILQMLKNK